MGRAPAGLRRPVLGRVTRAALPADARGDHVWVGHSASDLEGYAAALLTGERARAPAAAVPIVDRVASLAHLHDGDVVAIQPSGYIRTLYRVGSPHNSVFMTDRCNSLCLMCSQPPRPVDDRDALEEHLRLVDLIDPSPPALGITGGEPTLLGDGLVRLLEHCKRRLPATALHVLSNGRLFYYGSFARVVAEVEHPDLVFGIPLYADFPELHDRVVQCRGAFDETVIGLQNLARFGVAVEVRVVVHRLTYARLPQLAVYIQRNFPFVVQVALMGLEPIGLTLAHRDELWIDPWDYREQLEAAVLLLDDYGLPVSVYNHQLCVVTPAVRPFCRPSISDWKNEYLDLCADCRARSECGGFFASALEHGFSRHVRPFTDAP